MACIISAAEAVRLVPSYATIIVSGNGEFLNPDELLAALEARYLQTGEPRQLTLIYNVIPGSQRGGTGIDRFAHVGMLDCVIAGSYYTLEVDKLMELVNANEVKAYLVPFGALYNIVRCAAAGQPGFLTSVGIGTFVDPRVGGDRLTERTTESISRIMSVDGKEYLYYPAHSVDVAIIRATTADEDGNLTLEQEPISIGLLNQAMAAKNSGGIVIVQVKQIVKRGTLHPKSVVVPGIFVDYIVHAPTQMDAMAYNPAWTGDIRIPEDQPNVVPLDYKKVIVRRAAMELKPGNVVNFGFGLSAGVPQIAAEEGIADQVIFNVEHGPVGGVPNNKFAFGAGVNMMALMDAPSIFNFYDAGRLDMTCLGMAQIAPDGSVNVSLVNGKYNLGGFMDIVHSTKNIVFCGTFTTGGLQVGIQNGKTTVVRDGTIKKFVRSLQHVTFNGRIAFEKGQNVLYVTERAVFTLTVNGLELIEIAPGVDLKKDILNQMEFHPLVSQSLKEMDERLFLPRRMGLFENVRNDGPRGIV